MAAAVVAGWGGQEEGVFTDPEWGLEAAGSKPGDVGSWGRRPGHLQLWLDTDHSCPGSHLSGEPGLWEGAGAEASAVGRMTSPLEEVTEPNGAPSPGPRDAEGQGHGRAPAPSPRDSLASEDLEMFVLDLEDYDLRESTRGQLSPVAGGPACE